MCQQGHVPLLWVLWKKEIRYHDREVKEANISLKGGEKRAIQKDGVLRHSPYGGLGNTCRKVEGSRLKENTSPIHPNLLLTLCFLLTISCFHRWAFQVHFRFNLSSRQSFYLYWIQFPNPDHLHQIRWPYIRPFFYMTQTCTLILFILIHSSFMPFKTYWILWGVVSWSILERPLWRHMVCTIISNFKSSASCQISFRMCIHVFSLCLQKICR